MRVAAGLGAFLLLSALPGMAQSDSTAGAATAGSSYSWTAYPLTTICQKTLVPDKDKAPDGGQIVTVCKTAAVPACPIDMRVRQGIGGGLLAVDKSGAKRQVFAPRLRLFLNDQRPGTSGQRIVSATVTAHGSGGKAKILPLGSSSGENRDSDSADVERTFTVDLANWGEPGVSGDFRLPGFVSASRVDLESVTYEDGNTWRLTGQETCRVAPDMLMLVGD